MQQSKEAASVAIAEGRRILGFKIEGRIVHLQLFKSVLYVLVLFALGREYAAVHHGLRLLVSLQRLARRVGRQRDSVADPCVSHLLDAAADVADFAGFQFVCRHSARYAVAYLCDLVVLAGVHHSNYIAALYSAVKYPRVNNNALIAVII